MKISRRSVLAASASTPALTGLPAFAAPQRVVIVTETSANPVAYALNKLRQALTEQGAVLETVSGNAAPAGAGFALVLAAPGSPLTSGFPHQGARLAAEQFRIAPGKWSGMDALLISAGDISVNNLCLLIFNDINERIAIVDLRTRGLVGKKIDGRLEIKGVIRKVPFIEGVYRVGLYVTNNEEGKNFFDLIKFEVSDESEPEFIKYPKEVRGVIEVNNEIISLNSQ